MASVCSWVFFELFVPKGKPYAAVTRVPQTGLLTVNKSKTTPRENARVRLLKARIAATRIQRRTRKWLSERAARAAMCIQAGLRHVALRRLIRLKLMITRDNRDQSSVSVLEAREIN